MSDKSEKLTTTRPKTDWEYAIFTIIITIIMLGVFYYIKDLDTRLERLETIRADEDTALQIKNDMESGSFYYGNRMMDRPQCFAEAKQDFEEGYMQAVHDMKDKGHE